MGRKRKKIALGKHAGILFRLPVQKLAFVLPHHNFGQIVPDSKGSQLHYVVRRHLGFYNGTSPRLWHSMHIDYGTCTVFPKRDLSSFSFFLRAGRTFSCSHNSPAAFHTPPTSHLTPQPQHPPFLSSQAPARNLDRIQERRLARRAVSLGSATKRRSGTILVMWSAVVDWPDDPHGDISPQNPTTYIGKLGDVLVVFLGNIFMRT